MFPFIVGHSTVFAATQGFFVIKLFAAWGRKTEFNKISGKCWNKIPREVWESDIVNTKTFCTQKLLKEKLKFSRKTKLKCSKFKNYIKRLQLLRHIAKMSPKARGYQCYKSTTTLREKSTYIFQRKILLEDWFLTFSEENFRLRWKPSFASLFLKQSIDGNAIEWNSIPFFKAKDWHQKP